MTLQTAAFVRAHTSPQRTALVPELALYLGGAADPLWRAVAEWKGEKEPPFPFWAFAWPGGQALARYLLDRPEQVRGLRVLDFASGCGIGALAAAKAGAGEVFAADIDEAAQVATQLNAAANGVVVGTVRGIDLNAPLGGYDLIMAGDVCYEQTMSHRVVRWLRLCAVAGTRVLLADPGRAYAPEAGLVELVRLKVPTSRELEDKEEREVTIWEVSG